MGRLCIMIILLIPASGASDIFDIMDEKYITDISELPYSSGNPEINWQKQGHIEAWIDIVGFKNLSKENGTFYISGDPENLSIVQNGAQGVFSCEICGYNIKKTVQTSTSGANTVATLSIKMIWYSKHCGKNGCTCVEHIEFAMFNDVEKSPEQFDRVLNPQVNITEYNNSVNPRTEIQLTLNSPALAFINYTYNGNYIINYKMSAHVEKTPKDVYFANVSAANIWTDGTGSLRQMNDNVIIPGTADPDYHNLTIQASSLYKTENASFTIVRDTYKFERSFSGLYITLIIIFSILFGTLYYTAKRAFS